MNKRLTTLAPGTTWNMSDEDKAEVPMQWKLAATHLAGQFHRVVCTRWEMTGLDLPLNQAYGELEIAIYRDRDMYRKEAGTKVRRWWPIYKDDKPAPADAPTAPPVSRKVKRINYVDPVREDTHSISVHSLFVDRAYLNDDLRALDLKFARDPKPEHVVAMAEIRKQLSELEQQIVVAVMMKS
jgi:hypothetical protein